MGEEKQRAEKKIPKLEIPPALAAATALIVAVLATVGVSGDALTRAVRNDARPLVVVITLALLVVGGTVTYLNRGNRALAAAFLLLTLLLPATVVYGALALGVREQPRMTLSSKTDGDLVTVTIEAGGSSLKSDEDMLVQMHAVEDFPEEPDDYGLCLASHFDPDETGRDWPGPLLLWEQAGPGPDGTVAVESTIEVPVDQYEGVCGFVALSKGKDERLVGSFLRFPTKLD